MEYNQIWNFVLKSKLGEVAVRLKPEVKESGEPKGMFIENNNKNLQRDGRVGIALTL